MMSDGSFKDPDKRYFIIGSAQSPFIQLLPNGSGDDDNSDLQEFYNSPWKFHVSVAKADIEKAWNLIVDLILEDKSDLEPKFMYWAKVANKRLHDRFSDPEHAQAGKMVTVYTSTAHNPEHYMQFMRKVEQVLRDNNIQPGLKVKSDIPVAGSNFIFYRNEWEKSLVNPYKGFTL